MVKQKPDSSTFERYFSDRYSGDDRQHVLSFLREEADNEDLNSVLKSQFDSIGDDDLEAVPDLDHILHRIHYNINSRHSHYGNITGRRRALLWLAAVAAVMLPFIIFLGFQFLKPSYEGKEASFEIISPAWSRVRFSLPDGTSGWLNGGSSLSYNADFINDRKVALSGEAYFDVFHDEKSPFVVNTADVTLKVLGTRFNVSSYKSEGKVEVVLEEGKLLFTEHAGKKSYTLTPDDLVNYDKREKTFTTEKVQTGKYISWTEGKLIFRNDPVDVMARRLGRWYNADVEIRGDNFDRFRLRATFDDESLEQVLYFLKKSLPIDYTISDGVISANDTLSRRKVIITLK